MKNNRYPAVPLIVHDPYFSIWSCDDRLTDGPVRHWTGKPNPIEGILYLDGKPFRFLGADREIPETLAQIGLEVFPTRTEYTFQGAGIRFYLTFLTPALLDRPAVAARPVTYVIFRIESTDGAAHTATVNWTVSHTLCTEAGDGMLAGGRLHAGNAEWLCLGSTEQRPLHRSGDDVRIDWGYVLLGLPRQFAACAAFADTPVARKQFAATGKIPLEDNFDFPRSVHQAPGMTAAIPLDVPAAGECSAWLMMAYNDVAGVEFLERKLHGFWNCETRKFGEMLKTAEAEFASLRADCEAFDAELLADARRVGGDVYAEFCALSYRQSIGAHKACADVDGRLLFFSKENFSNGCIATVDVTYPSAPLYLLLNPDYLKGMLLPILDYAQTTRWKFPYAPHDLGTYPLANGQVYGGGEDTDDCQMPVEECGNLLILAGTLNRFTDDRAFFEKYRPLFSRWAEYLLDKGLDPENQLCTDDFAGHFAHNANLSLKAIVALACYAGIEETLGDTARADAFRAKARAFAAEWLKLADDGDHYRLAFDRPGSWSQKYNLVWDEILELGVFPPAVAQTELAYYRRQLREFGLPLDNRRTYTKLDWIFWVACLDGGRAFETLTAPLGKWLRDTPSRVPLTDWFETVDGRQVAFQARSVVGGVFLRLLADPEIRRKWQARCKKNRS